MGNTPTGGEVSIIIDGKKTDFNQHRIRRTMRGHDGSYPIIGITRD